MLAGSGENIRDPAGSYIKWPDPAYSQWIQPTTIGSVGNRLDPAKT